MPEPPETEKNRFLPGSEPKGLFITGLQIPIENLPGFDPIWFKYSKEITVLAEAINPWLKRTDGEINGPKTEIGQSLLDLEAKTLLFKHYRRLVPIYGALISLIEGEQTEFIVYPNQEKNQPQPRFFEDVTNQRIVLRAFGLVVERSLKTPVSFTDPSCYTDYHRFFEEMEGGLLLRRDEDRRCKPSLDYKLETSFKFDDFLGTVAGFFSDCVNTQIKRRVIAWSMDDLNSCVYTLRSTISQEVKNSEFEQRQKILQSLGIASRE